MHREKNALEKITHRKKNYTQGKKTMHRNKNHVLFVLSPFTAAQTETQQNIYLYFLPLESQERKHRQGLIFSSLQQFKTRKKDVMFLFPSSVVSCQARENKMPDFPSFKVQVAMGGKKSILMFNLPLLTSFSAHK